MHTARKEADTASASFLIAYRLEYVFANLQFENGSAGLYAQAPDRFFGRIFQFPILEVPAR